MNWFRNARFRKKFFFAFGIPLSFFLILTIFEMVALYQVESAFVKLSEGPNKRIVYASDAVSEFAYCRSYILSMGYSSDDIDYINECYEGYLASSGLIMRCLDSYYDNFISDESLSDTEKEFRAVIITDVRNKFSGEYKHNVEALHEAAVSLDRENVNKILAEGFPLSAEITDSLRNLREMVQIHVDNLTDATHAFSRNAIGFMLGFAVVIAAVSFSLSIYISSALRKPIEQMEWAMSEIVRGNLTYPIRNGLNDELGILSNQIGDMVDTISVINKAMAIIDNVDDNIYVTDLNCNLIFMNRKISERFSIDKDVCVGQKCYKMIYGENEPCKFCPLPDIFAQKENLPAFDWEQRIPANGMDVWFAFRTSIIRWVDGSLVQIITCRDDTLRKTQEEEQKRHADELRDAALIAQSALLVKSSFLANVSHELRTPMNVIMGMSELILRKELPQDVYESALSIRTASQNLLSIITNILDLSQIESGKLEIVSAEYDFVSLMNDIISIIKIRLVEKPITFIVNIDPRIPEFLTGDEVRVRQVLLNLLDNAVKYTVEGCVSLTVSGEFKNEAITLTTVIADSGIGIKEEEITSLFDNFVQSEINNNGFDGTGFGLPISLRLCKAMGGNIVVHSEYGKGSTFTVTIPQKYEKGKPCAEVLNPDKISVLLYEPSIEHRDSIAQALNALDISCEIVNDTSALLDNPEKYSHIFIPSELYENVNESLLNLSNPPRIVILSEITEKITLRNAQLLTYPAYSMPLANILNDVFEERDGSFGTRESFSAPDANILIVDDMTSNLMVARGLMSPYEMNITTCASGVESVKLVSENRYDLIFMDHMMPVMDGIEATGCIRSMEGEYFKSVPIIALTANAVSGVREMFISNGMNDFLAKPIETAKLNTILEKWIPVAKRIKKIPAEQPVLSPADESDFINSLKSIHGLSAEKAVSVMGGSLETYEGVFRLSIRLLPENITALSSHLDKNDMKSYSIEVHGIKGVLNNIGVYELGKTAYELEEFSLRGDAEECGKRHPGFISRLSEFLNNASAAIAVTTTEEKPVREKQILLVELPKLDEAIEFFNAMQAIEILTAVSEFTYGEEVDDVIENLLRTFEQFDFDRAVELTDKLREALE